jgi:hypothetical protein
MEEMMDGCYHTWWKIDMDFETIVKTMWWHFELRAMDRPVL